MKLVKILLTLVMAVWFLGCGKTGSSQDANSAANESVITDQVVAHSTLQNYKMQALNATDAYQQALTNRPIDPSQLGPVADMGTQLEEYFDKLIAQIEGFEPQLEDEDAQKAFEEAKAQILEMVKAQREQLTALFKGWLDHATMILSAHN